MLADAPAADQVAPLLAAWFHDLVYEAGRSDNEETSTRLLHQAADELTLPPAIVSAAARMVGLTKTYTPSTSAAECAFMDADLAILGSPPAVYDSYARAIRLEFGRVRLPAFRDGRIGVLRRFLAREQIYQTDRARQMLERPARRNLAAEIDRWSATLVLCRPSNRYCEKPAMASPGELQEHRLRNPRRHRRRLYKALFQSRLTDH